MTQLNCSPANLRRLYDLARHQTGWTREVQSTQRTTLRQALTTLEAQDAWFDFSSDLGTTPTMSSYLATEEEYFRDIVWWFHYEINLAQRFVEWLALQTVNDDSPSSATSHSIA